MTYCRKCGNQIEDGASFCRSCGTQVTVPILVQNVEVLPPVTARARTRPDVLIAQAMVDRQHPQHHPPSNVSVVVNTPHQQMGDVGLMLLIESRKKSGWLAAFLNLIFPGAGYIYCDRPLLGIVVFVFIVAVFIFTLGMLAWVFMPILFIDGFLCAGRYNREMTAQTLRTQAR